MRATARQLAPLGWRGLAAPAVALLLVLSGALAMLGGSHVALHAAARWAVAQFPVRAVGTEALARLLESPQPPLLVDARPPAEVAASHLPGAVAWDDATGAPPPPQVEAALREGRDVVVYCSIGYRSGRAAGKLCQLHPAARQQVRNLEGGIFLWATEGRPLEGGDRVHPYDAIWSRLLPRRLRAPLTPSARTPTS